MGLEDPPAPAPLRARLSPAPGLVPFAASGTAGLLPCAASDRRAPEADPLATELLAGAVKLAEPAGLAPEDAGDEALEGAAAGAGAASADDADCALAAGDALAEAAAAVPSAGIPISGPEQAQARLTPASAVASIANTAEEKRRACLLTRETA